MTPDWPLDDLRRLIASRGEAIGRPQSEIQQLSTFLDELHASCVRNGQDSPAPQVDTDGGELALAWFHVRRKRSLHIGVEDGIVVLSTMVDAEGHDYTAPSEAILDAEIRDFFPKKTP